MSLRKPPTPTPAFLAAHRANSLKSTGPRTARGKARVALNALQHGQYAVALEHRLARAGDHEGAALYHWFYSEIARAFGVTTVATPGGPGSGQVDRVSKPLSLDERQHAEQFATRAWCVARQAARWSRTQGAGRGSSIGAGALRGDSETKLECPLFSEGNESRIRVLLRIRIDDPYRRIGLVFWLQRRRDASIEALVGRILGEPPPRPITPGLASVQPLENAWHRRRFRLRRPGLWERQALEEQLRRVSNTPPTGRAPRSSERAGCPRSQLASP